MRLDSSVLEVLKSSKNLLALSCGIDSTALFFILKNNLISFDIAVVDYNTRDSSKDEVAYAKKLAKSFNKTIFIKECHLQKSNFEKNARDVRYSFFKEIIKEGSYDNLITAHQLNDKFEWFLMQLSKGAGCLELLGMDEIEKRDGFNLIRPLLKVPKEELILYLNKNNIKYFEDVSNINKRHFRNRIRDEFANKFIKNYANGVRKSFNYLDKDKNLIIKNTTTKHIKDLTIMKRTNISRVDMFYIDKALKSKNYLLSKEQKDEILKNSSVVIGSKFAIEISANLIYISPYITNIKMNKKFKEFCRVNNIPKKIRGYLYNIKDSYLEELTITIKDNKKTQ